MKYDELIKLTQDLIRIPSLSGEEKEIVEFIESKLKEFGYDEIYVNKFRTIYGIVKSGKPGPNIILDAHIDHVVVNNPDLWTVDPFGAEIKDNKIWGRATSDMKGAFAAMVYAGKYFAEHRNEFTGNIIVSGTTWEELFEGKTLGFEIEELKEKGYNPDLVVIGEASNLNLKIGQRGRCEVQITVYGKSCHSSNPEYGINAVYKAIEVINTIKNKPVKEDSFIGKAIFELTDIISKPYPGYSVVPEETIMSYDRRLLPGETKESVLKEVKDALNPLKEKDPELKFKIEIKEGPLYDVDGNEYIKDKFAPGWVFDKNELFVQKAYQALINTELNPEITRYLFCTNGSTSAGIMGIPTIGYGPSKESQAHVVDEYIEIEQLEKAYEGYVNIIKEFSKE